MFSICPRHRPTRAYELHDKAKIKQLHIQFLRIGWLWPHCAVLCEFQHLQYHINEGNLLISYLLLWECMVVFNARVHYCVAVDDQSTGSHFLSESSKHISISLKIAIPICSRCTSASTNFNLKRSRKQSSSGDRKQMYSNNKPSLSVQCVKEFCSECV